MKVNIYYGGRGLLDDPTLYVLNKMEEVLRELRVTVERINIYEHKNEIATLPQTMKEADGIILATTIEWLGIGGYMQQFLDACWLYGDKEKIQTTYMQPIVMSTTYGEREGEMTLANAWEILGGLPCPGLCGYVEDLVAFEMNKDYTVIIEKKAENLYRTISQKMKSLPNSNLAVRQSVLRTPQLELTPQESEQLSKYVSDDSYVSRRKIFRNWHPCSRICSGRSVRKMMWPISISCAMRLFRSRIFMRDICLCLQIRKSRFLLK